MTLCYKVVMAKSLLDESKGFRSIATFEPYSVDYKVGEETVPSIDGTPLFVFDTLVNAENFNQNCNVILECEYDELFPVQDAGYTSIAFEKVSAKDMADYWNRLKEDHSLFDDSLCYNIPEGTLLVCSVKVIREI
jgi:hypothetical protein